MTQTVPSGIDEIRLQVLVQGILVENPHCVGPDEFLRSTRM